MKIGVVLGCLVVLGLAGSADAQQPAPRNVCAPANAQKATVEAIASDPAAWMGKCVTVHGIYAGERIYKDVDAAYGVSNAVIGGYADARTEGFWSGEFTGRVSDCARAENDLQTGLLRSPGVSLHERTLGCMAPEGPFLVFMSQHDVTPAKVVRRMPGAKGGDLVAAQKDWPHLAAVEKLAADFIAALRAEDRTQLARFAQNAYEVEQLLGGRATAIDDLKKPVDRPMQVFVHRPSESADTTGAEVCYCRTKDCTKRWPIARRDADNQTSRPYACIRIDGERDTAAAPWSYKPDVSLYYDGLPER